METTLHIGLVRRGRAAHQPHDVALLDHIMGVCNSGRCVGNHRWAEVKAFYDGRLMFRCDGCKAESWLNPGDPVLNPEAPFYPDEPGLRKPIPPWMNDEDAEHPRRDYSDFNRPNGRIHFRR